MEEARAEKDQRSRLESERETLLREKAAAEEDAAAAREQIRIEAAVLHDEVEDDTVAPSADRVEAFRKVVDMVRGASTDVGR